MRLNNLLCWSLMILSWALPSACRWGTPEYQRPDPEVYDEALETDPSRAAWYNIKLGIAYLEQGQVARAKVKLLHAQELAPTLPATQYALGMYYEQIGELSDAEQAYRKAVAHAPTSGETLNNLGAFLCRQERYTEAEQVFMEALKDPEYPNTAAIWENAGMCAQAEGDRPKAKQYFLHAYRQDPKRSETVLELSALALEEKQLTESQKWLKIHESLGQPESARALWVASQLAKEKGQLKEAKRIEQALARQFPGSAEAKQLGLEKEHP